MGYTIYFLFSILCIVAVVAVIVGIMRWVLRINERTDAINFLCQETEKTNYMLSKIVQNTEGNKSNV